MVESGAVIGRGTRILANAVVTGHATIGQDCEIHFSAVVGHEPQDLTFEGASSRVIIGDRTILREFVTIHRATAEGGATTIGEDCLLMVNSHVAHDCTIGNNVVICNSALIAGHVTVEDRGFLSGNTVVHQFARVGKLVMLSGLSGIGRDVGPYLTVARRGEVTGLNTVGMRRAGYDGAARRRVREAYRALFQADTLDEGLALVREGGAEHEDITAILEFYGKSRRGYARPATRKWLETQAV